MIVYKEYNRARAVEYARRWALFRPTPGSAAKRSIRLSRAAGKKAMVDLLLA